MQQEFSIEEGAWSSVNQGQSSKAEEAWGNLISFVCWSAARLIFGKVELSCVTNSVAFPWEPSAGSCEFPGRSTLNPSGLSLGTGDTDEGNWPSNGQDVGQKEILVPLGGLRPWFPLGYVRPQVTSHSCSARSLLQETSPHPSRGLTSQLCSLTGTAVPWCLWEEEASLSFLQPLFLPQHKTMAWQQEQMEQLNPTQRIWESTNHMVFSLLRCCLPCQTQNLEKTSSGRC